MERLCKNCIYLVDKKLISHHLYWWCDMHNCQKQLDNKCKKFISKAKEE